MKAISVRGLWAGLLAAGSLGAAAIALTGSASAGEERAGSGGATLKMTADGRKLDFEGAKSVGAGERLKIVNKTNPRQIGPHTFTLVRLGLVDSKAEQRECGRIESRVCRAAFRAHKVDPKTFEVGKPNLDSGKTGWDRQFTKQDKGDSWYTERRGDSQSRKVTADAGERLGFFCLVHPNMQGKIEVKD